MKILALSLLRIGDLLMHQAVIREIKKQFPKAEVHVLVNDSVGAVLPIISGVDKWWRLPRQVIQDHLVQDERNPHYSFFTLRQLTEKLNEEKFDKIYNLTHNTLSARLMDSLICSDKVGMCFEQGQLRKINNPWLSYFNNIFSSSHQTHFHYLEALSSSLGLPQPGVSVSASQGSETFLIQPLTSDAKKNWGLSQWRQFLHQARQSMPGTQWLVLGAPQERDQLLTHFSETDLKIINFEKLAGLLGTATALVTGDTSVLHLARQMQVPTMSLYMGSANVLKTAPWIHGGLILTSRQSCAPCWHADPCRHDQHFCAQDFSVDEVLSAFQFWQNKNVSALDQLAGTSPLNYFQIQNLPWRSYFIWQLGDHAFMKNYQRALGQLVWQIYLDSSDKSYLAPYGTAAMWFSQDCLLNFSSHEMVFAWLNRRAIQIDQQLQTVDSLRSKIASAFNGDDGSDIVQAQLSAIDSSIDPENDYFFRYLQNKNDNTQNKFKWFNEIRQSLNEAERLLSIERRLLRQIATEVEQRGTKNVRISELSQVSYR